MTDQSLHRNLNSVGSESFQVADHRGARRLVPGEGMEAPSHIPCPTLLFLLEVHLYALSYPFIINQYTLVSLRSVSCSSKYTELKEGPWEPLIHSWLVRSAGGSWHLKLWVPTTEPLACGL